MTPAAAAAARLDLHSVRGHPHRPNRRDRNSAGG